MFAKLTNADLLTAIDEMVASVGVKEELPYTSLTALLGGGNTQACVQEIASRLGLPILIRLSYVPQGFEPGNSAKFRSSDLARTDWTGHGVEGITAQVSIPESIPLYGSTSLSGYPIGVRVSEGCAQRAETFITVMAHELSHVLLRAIRHAQRDSELHTDLIPILLGFGECVERGRKSVRTDTDGSRTTTHTTTYGYLTDSQFQFVRERVKGLLQRYENDKKRLVKRVAETRLRLQKANRQLTSFRDYLGYLDKHRAKRIRPFDAPRIVGFHAWDYTRGWERSIKDVQERIEESAAFAGALNHYTSNVVERVEERTLALGPESEALAKVTDAIESDLRTLRRYVSLIYRIRMAISRKKT